MVLSLCLPAERAEGGTGHERNHARARHGGRPCRTSLIGTANGPYSGQLVIVISPAISMRRVRRTMPSIATSSSNRTSGAPGHMCGPSPRALLLDMFGAEYVATVSRLLTMEWLYSERVSGNLERAFGVTLRSG